MNKKEIIEKMSEIEQTAIKRYTDNIGITDIMLETMTDEELKEYNYLHIEHLKSCFYCGTTYDCEYCKGFDLVDVEDYEHCSKCGDVICKCFKEQTNETPDIA